MILKISERAVRQIELRAFEKLRQHPVLKEFWQEYQTGEIKEAELPQFNQCVLSRAEIAALYSLAYSAAERHALTKLLALAAEERRLTLCSPF